MRLLSRIALAAAVLAGSLAATPVAVAGPPPAQRPPAGSYDERHLLVTFAPGTPGQARAAAHANERARVVNRFDWLDTDVVEVREGEDAADVAPRYSRNPNVVDTDLNWKYSIDSEPNDPLFRELWGLHNTGQSVTGSFVQGAADVDLDAPEGWDTAFGSGAFPSSGGTRVGILDTGIDLSHVDLMGKTKACASATAAIGLVVEGACSDDNLHGTHVAGTVGAIANNGAGVAGVAPNAELAVFKALNAAGAGFYADVIAGIHWLHTKGNAKIISMSIGGPKDSNLDKELSEAAAAGTLLIAAAGNDGDSTPNYPAFHPDVVSVGAIDAAGSTAWFSNCNQDLEVVAPGVDIWSTLPGNAYGPLDGTSMATPHVSGLAAVLMWRNGLTAEQTRSRLSSGAERSVTCTYTEKVSRKERRQVEKTVPLVNLNGALGGGGATT